MSDSITVRIQLNDSEHILEIEPRRIVADVLRDEFEIGSIHLGCEHGACGACTILVDGEPAAACMILAGQVDGRSLTTLEGLQSNGLVKSLQSAFHQRFALQCGYCTPGMLVSLFALIGAPEENLDLDEERIREHLRGNLCRCTGYQSIVSAALDVIGGSVDAEDEKGAPHD